MGFDEIRLEAQGLPVLGDCLLQPTLVRKRVGEHAVRFGVNLHEAERFLELVDALVQPPLPPERLTEHAVCRGVILVEAEHCVKLGDGLVKLVLFVKNRAKIQMSTRTLRPEGNSSRKVADRLVQARGPRVVVNYP